MSGVHRQRLLPPAVRAPLEAWITHVGKRIGFDYHRSSTHHTWHCDVRTRQDVTRDELLKKHHLAPDHHVDPDPETGLPRWAGEVPKRLRDDVRTYFLGRREDG